MIWSLGKLTVAAAAGLLLAAGASAQPAPPMPAATIQRTITSWGLLGTWTVDCARPVGEQWARLRYTVTPQGGVVQERDFGDPKRNDRLDVTSATLAKGGAIELALYNNNSGQTRLVTMTKQPDKRIRAMANRVRDGEVVIANGRFVATGNETPALQKCD